MNCEPVFNAQTKQITGVVCGDFRSRAKCQFCGSRCDYECDFPVGKKTCDKKICHPCAKHSPYLLPTDEKITLRDSKDFCPTHAAFAFQAEAHFIYVVNSDFSLEPKAQLIDRNTSLGNPYKLTKDEPHLRADVIAKYKRWLWENMKLPSSIPMVELQRLAALAATQDLVLRCWCAPKPCHGQIVAAAICYLIKLRPSPEEP